MTPSAARVVIAEEVRDALGARRGVVALETTLLVHGLPTSEATRVSVALERAVRERGAVPATVGMVDGVAVVGLVPAAIERLIERREHVRKLSTRDLGLAAAAGIDGATTVAATIALAAEAGIEVMATGGIGGVHLGAAETYDESADLAALARTPVLVVASGAKSILDIAATLERLDTLGVPVVGYRTTQFPGFYVRDSGMRIAWSLETPEQAADAFAAHRELGRGGMLLANPIPEVAEMDASLHASALADGLHLVIESKVSGADVTPFLLAHFAAATGGASLAANVALVLDNAALAASIAIALATTTP